MQPPAPGDTWLALTTEALPVAAVYEWMVRADCGAVVVFSGTVRDHAEGRTGVDHLVYEAYEEYVLPRFEAITAEVRQQWPEARRVAILHRTGRVEVGESSVIVAVSSPHRGEAFDAARYAIDTVKASVPIWKQESWEGGEAWGVDAQPLTDVTTSPRRREW